MATIPMKITIRTTPSAALTIALFVIQMGLRGGTRDSEFPRAPPQEP